MERIMKAKAAIVSIFALVLAAALVSGEQHRLRSKAAVDGDAGIERLHIATKEVDVTN
jgi:hypothetical protein